MLRVRQAVPVQLRQGVERSSRRGRGRPDQAVLAALGLEQEEEVVVLLLEVLELVLLELRLRDLERTARDH